jgi:hypothetical protein
VVNPAMGGTLPIPPEAGLPGNNTYHYHAYSTTMWLIPIAYTVVSDAI